MAVGAVMLDAAGASSSFAARVEAGPRGIVEAGADRARAARGGSNALEAARDLAEVGRARAAASFGIGVGADLAA